LIEVFDLLAFLVYVCIVGKVGKFWFIQVFGTRLYLKRFCFGPGLSDQSVL